MARSGPIGSLPTIEVLGEAKYFIKPDGLLIRRNTVFSGSWMVLSKSQATIVCGRSREVLPAPGLEQAMTNTKHAGGRTPDYARKTVNRIMAR
jgi:hypothetical protein